MRTKHPKYYRNTVYYYIKYWRKHKSIYHS